MITFKTDPQFGPIVALLATGLSNGEISNAMSRKNHLPSFFPVSSFAGRLQYQAFDVTADAINSHSGAARF
jgi:hypothetical protein